MQIMHTSAGGHYEVRHLAAGQYRVTDTLTGRYCDATLLTPALLAADTLDAWRADGLGNVGAVQALLTSHLDDLDRETRDRDDGAAGH